MTLEDYRALPGFRARAQRLETTIRRQVAMNLPIDLADVAAELQVPSEIAATWVTVLAIEMGETLRITPKGLPN
jgi:hypothetical protein